MSRWPTFLVVFTLILPAGLLPGADAHAQVKWVWVDALGYGGAGVGLAVLASWERASFDEAFPVIAAGAAVGLVAGGLIGSRADEALAQGEEIGPGHRALVVGGSVLAGATLGALGSAALIEGQGEGTPLASDESTFALLTTGGALLGAAFAWWRRGDLLPRGVNVAPSVDPMGGAGVVVRYRF